MGQVIESSDTVTGLLLPCCSKKWNDATGNKIEELDEEKKRDGVANQTESSWESQKIVSGVVCAILSDLGVEGEACTREKAEKKKNRDI